MHSTFRFLNICRSFKRLWISLLVVTVFTLAKSAEIREAADALNAALNDEPTRDRIRNLDSIRSSARYLDQWDVWMVEFFEEDHQIAFATINQEGEILERGPEPGEQQERKIKLERLHDELAFAKQTGNQAEVEELLELIEVLKKEEEIFTTPLDRNALLESVQAVGSYGVTILRWPPARYANDLILNIERWDESAWGTEGTIPFSTGRWVDYDVRPGESNRYRISWDIHDEKPKVYREFEVTPKSFTDSKLQVYQINIPEDGLVKMLTDVNEDIEIDGSFAWNNQSWPIEIRLRGASTRHAAKKSYRVEFKKDSPFPRDVIYLKAEPMDHTMQQEKLSCDLFRANQALCFQAKYINLILNGRYEGVYLDVEPLRVPFMNHPDLNPRGSLIRASTFGWWQDKPLGKLRGKGNGIAHLKAFLHQARSVENKEFETWIKTHMDWPAVRDYLALQTLCHRSEIEADDYFFYHNPDTKKWSLIPWDHNNGNFAVSPYGNRVRKPSISVFPQTIQDIGWEAEHSYMLHSRIFRTPALRREYLDRLSELTIHWFIEGKVDDLIEANFERIKDDYILDPYRNPFEGNDPFLSSSIDLKHFAEIHGKRLLQLIEKAKRNQAPISMDFVSRTPKAAKISFTLASKLETHLKNYQLVFKRENQIRFIKLANSTTITPGQTIDLNIQDIPKQGGLLCLVRGKNLEDDAKHLIDFCFIPDLL